jgi:hypothetical protein
MFDPNFWKERRVFVTGGVRDMTDCDKNWLLLANRSELG